MLWYGHFAWVLHYEGQNGRAKFCGDADDNLLSPIPRVCASGARNGILSPFASGGLDVRSRSLIERLVHCEQLWAYVRNFDLRNASYGASCDGQQGYFVAKCLAQHGAGTGFSGCADSRCQKDRYLHPQNFSSESNRLMTAIHLPWPKFHPPSRRFGARLHTSLLHPHRPCVLPTIKQRPKPTWSGAVRARNGALPVGADALPPQRPAGRRDSDCLNPVPKTWRWNLGQGLLPFRFHIHGEVTAMSGTSVGLPFLWWLPYNRSHLLSYKLLHKNREDDRYCDVLPCGVTFSTSTSTSSDDGRGGDGHHNVNAARPANVSACTTMQSCVAGGGGRYWYQGEEPGRPSLVPWGADAGPILRP